MSRKTNDIARMYSSLLDGVEFGDFRYQGGSQFTTMTKTGFPFTPEEVAEILSFLEE